jgi:hypothetical protein
VIGIQLFMTRLNNANSPGFRTPLLCHVLRRGMISSQGRAAPLSYIALVVRPSRIEKARPGQ